MREQKDVPFKSLGVQLQELRRQFKESLADVAGAVEIDETLLKRIEHGAERPSEDILMLLISHFDIHEDEATNLWLLAGYDMSDDIETGNFEDIAAHSLVVMMTLDTRILYSDQAQVTADKHGMVVSFLQNNSGIGSKSQKLPVARIGMSYEQAQDLLSVLQKTLLQSEQLRRPKGLPAPKSNARAKPRKTETN